MARGPVWRIGLGSPDRTAIMVAAAVGRSKGGCPSSAAYSVAPSDHRSDSGVAGSPWSRSGGRKAGVPTIPPVRVIPVSCVVAAIPKSVSTTRPSSASSTFSGLTSRCRTPAACAARSAPSTLSPTAATCSGERPALADRLAQRARAHQLHDDPGPPALLDHVVDDDHGRVVEPPGGPRLPDGPPVQVGPLGLVDPAVADLLDRHDPVEQFVVGAPDDAHPAFADGLEQVIPARHPAFGHLSRPSPAQES
nr:hypothetical protein GCM10020093_115410 [Planobispora longispora]